MDFGVFVQRNDINDLVADATSVADFGFANLWIPQIFDLDAIGALGIVAREVPDLNLGTAVVPTYPRHPAALAAQARTTQQASNGRFTLGIGLSHQIVIEGMYGMDWSKPIGHLRNYLDILLPLLAGQPVSVDGAATYRGGLDIPAADVPTVVAALGTQMLNLAGSRTHGTITWMTGTATIADHVAPTIRQAAADAGRPEPQIVQALPVCVTDDVAGVRAQCDSIFEIYKTLPSYRAMLDKEGVGGPGDVAIIGSVHDVKAAIDASRNAGVTQFVAVPFHERERTLEVIANLIEG